MAEFKQADAAREVEIQRLGRNGYLHRIIPLVDHTGKVVDRIVKPLMVEFHLKDVMQVFVGSTILAIPAAYTEEAWNLGLDLGVINIVGIALMSLVFVGLFVYQNSYRGYLRQFIGQFFVRVFATYGISLITVALLLTLVDQAPWGEDTLLAIKRIVVVGFPASMSATVTDSLK